MQNIVKFKYKHLKFANFVYFCIDARQSDDHIRSLTITTLHYTTEVASNFKWLDIPHFYVILQANFTIVLIKLLMTLFPAVVMNLSNSQVRLKGERSIHDAFRFILELPSG